MKIAKQIKIDGRTYTQLQCLSCGAVTKVKGALASKGARHALERSCATCEPNPLPVFEDPWYWKFGLKSNPYVYGPMPARRTSKPYRMEEARRMGWMVFMWNDGLKEDRLKRAEAAA